MANKTLKNLVVPVIVVILAFVILALVNTQTYPVIVQARMQGEVGPALDAMPNAKGFEELKLDNLPSTVQTVYRETSGQGYVVKVSTTEGFTKEAIVFYVAIDGKNEIQKINVTSYPETREVGDGYVDTYIGENSTLAGVELVAGVTYSSSAIKNGVAAAFSALVDNNLMKAAAKEPDQLYRELLPVVFNTSFDSMGRAMGDEFTSSVSGVKSAIVSVSGTEAAYWYSNGDDNYAVITNGSESKVYTLEGEDAYSSFSESVRKEIEAEAGDHVKSLVEVELASKPDTVMGVWRDMKTKGYVVEVSTTKGYTKLPIEMLITIDSENKVQEVKVTDYPETREVGEKFVSSFNGQDSTLSGVELVSSVTYSSSAMKNAVADAFSALADNGLIVAAKKEPKQLFEELLPSVFDTAYNPAGMLVADEFTSSISGTVRALKAKNNGAVAYWYSEGEENNWIVVSNGEVTKVYDLDGKDVTASFSEDLKAQYAQEAKANVTDTTSSDIKRFKKYVAGSTVTAIPVPLFNGATTAFECVTENGTYYGFGVRPYAFENTPLTMYISIDDKGAIYTFNSSSLYVDPEYFTHSEPEGYTTNIIGVTSDWTGDEALITGATLTSDAVKDAINDVFACFEAIKGGN